MRRNLIKRDNAANDSAVNKAESQRWVVRASFLVRASVPFRNEPWYRSIMNKRPRSPDHNVVQIPAKPFESRGAARDGAGPVAAPAARTGPGSPDDPRMREAMRLMQAFLAVEDAAARSAIITLAEGLVSFDWVRKAQQR
jgi:hypothetical protein